MYSKEIRLKAVEMRRGGETVSVISKKLGISPSTLNNWFLKGHFRKFKFVELEEER